MRKYIMKFPRITIVMSGVFGTKGSVLSDLNLALHVVLLVILLAGLRLGKKKTGSALKAHGQLMTVLTALNGLSIILIMGPSLLLHFGAAVEEAFVMGFPLTLLHHSIGLAAEILGLILVFKKFGKVRTWMRVTFTCWLVALLSGIGFYIMYYVI